MNETKTKSQVIPGLPAHLAELLANRPEPIPPTTAEQKASLKNQINSLEMMVEMMNKNISIAKDSLLKLK